MTGFRRLCFFVLFIAAALSAQSKELRVLSASPRGATRSIDQSFRILVTFSEPMTALTVGPDTSAHFPLEISPRVKGTYRWLGTTTLAFIPSDTLPFATAFTATIPAGTRSLSGAELPQPHTWTFETPRPSIVYIVPDERFGRIEPDRPIVIHFNQPIDLQKIGEWISVYDIDTTNGIAPRHKISLRRPTNEELLADPGARYWRTYDNLSDEEQRWVGVERRRALVIEPSTPYKKGGRIYLECRGGLKSTDGELGMAEWKVMTFSIFGDLKFEGVANADHTNPDGQTVFIFSNPVARLELLSHLTITPDVGIDRASKYDRQDEKQNFSFDLKPETEYHGTITAGMKDIFGNEIQSDVLFTFRTSAYPPSVSMATGPRVIEAYEKHAIDVKFLNCDSVAMTMGALQPDQIVPFVSETNLYDDRDWNVTVLVGKENDGRIERVWAMSNPHNRSVTRQLDLDEVLGPNHKGIGFVQMIRVGKKYSMPRPLKSVVRVTDIGLTLKVSPDSILVWATHLKDASPVRNADIEVRTDANEVVWRGRTDADGMARAPGWGALDIDVKQYYGTSSENWMAASPRLWVIAQKDGDCSYASSQGENDRRPDIGWNIRTDWYPQPEKFTGVLFTDRGLYKTGETANIKTVIRLRKGGAWYVVPDALARIRVRDPRGDEVMTEDVRLDEFGSMSIAFPVKLLAPTGVYTVSVAVYSTKTMRFNNVWMHASDGSFRVEAFRPAEFEVHAGFEHDSYTLGDTVLGHVSARYLFGAPMKKAPIEWNWMLTPASFTPRGYEAYSFGGGDWMRKGTAPAGATSKNGKAMLDDSGSVSLPVQLQVKDYRGTYSFQLRGGATSASNQNLWSSASVIIHGGDYYVGVKPGTAILPADSTITSLLVTVTKDGVPVPDRSVVLKIYRRTWHSVYRPNVMEMFAWDTQIVDSLADSAVVKTSKRPLKHHFKPSLAGYYIIAALSVDDRGDTITTQASFYASGGGNVPWGRYAANRIELVADRTEYAPGDKAEILVKNPYERATGLISIEREGILAHYTTVLEGGTPRLRIPIEHSHLPNIFVSVLLLHGSSDHPLDSTEIENTRPSFRMGYLKLSVSPKERHLHVGVETSRSGYQPGDTVTAVVTVRNASGAGVKSNLVISAADLGVLDLIDYRLPDPFDTFYRERALGVTTTDTRLYLRTQRDASMSSAATSAVRIPGEMGYRKDFAPTAYWNPSLMTDDSGRATVRFRLPDNITSFRLMAMAQTISSEFGEGETSFTVTKPLLLQPSLPPLARVGDVFDAGTVVINNTKEEASVTVTASASGITLQGNTQTHIDLAPGDAREVTFHFTAEKLGKAVVEFTAESVKDHDGLQWSFPIVSPRVKESVALCNSSTEPMREEQLFIPEAVDTTDGALELTASSTALVGLSGAMSYLFNYPYGCLEQRVSSMLPIILADDLVEAFGFDIFRNRSCKEVAQRTLDELMRFQTYDGGFSYWPGGERRMPYISAYAVYALLEAKERGYDVNGRALEDGLKYLAGKVVEKESELGDTPEAARSTRAFILYTLARAGRTEQRAVLDTLYAKRDSLPLFARAYLLRASALLKPGSPMTDDLARDLMNYLKVDPTGASFEEPNENGLASIFHSNTRTTALILQALVETNREPAVAERIVRRLLSVQRNGRWRTTQENLYVVSALAAYYKKFEAEDPDFSAEIAMNGKTLLKELFEGRSLGTKKEHVPFSVLLKGKAQPVSIAKQGEGRLYYGIRLNYRPIAEPAPRCEGLTVSRRIEPLDSNNGAEMRTGMLLKVTVNVVADQDRHYVAVDDPVPAGFEVVSTSFVTSDSHLKENDGAWSRFNHVERYDDRVSLFADYMPAGVHSYTYYARAIHAGTFVVPPTHAECMYEPEVFGSTASGVITIHK